MQINEQCRPLDYKNAMATIVNQLDNYRGAVFGSNYEVPGRYKRWEFGFINPPWVIESHKLDFEITCLNSRGQIHKNYIFNKIKESSYIEKIENKDNTLIGKIKSSDTFFSEEQRSKQNSVFSLIREILKIYNIKNNNHLGLYGAFGYDLAFQFEKIIKKIERDANQRDCVLYFPDEIIIVDHYLQQSKLIHYDFSYENNHTQDIPRIGTENKFSFNKNIKINSGDHIPGEYANTVKLAKEKFKKGDLFEAVPGQCFYRNLTKTPSEVYKNLKQQNPSPYGFFINLGENEYLVGASPEMFVRVEDKKIETCPISGTIKRGDGPIEDADNILTLLNSEKEKAELTMCTDVDRNDKSRICEPGSVRLLARRQIELYSKLIHTVDHVVGTLRDGFDAIDAFLTHTWAVTVTGAPKHWAMQFVEDHEKSARKWYGGAVGYMLANGNMNTGLTLRTIRIKEGVAEVRAGATLLYDSDPQAEEQETRLKASALLDAIEKKPTHSSAVQNKIHTKNNKKILLLDHDDSFIHTLANYCRQTGAEVFTYKYTLFKQAIEKIKPDCVLLSPGPGRPRDFELHSTIEYCLKKSIPLFGVCLGLQGIVEYFGGELAELDTPVHGKPAMITNLNGQLFENLGKQFQIARYHSLYSIKNKIPDCLKVTAETADNIPMAIEHKTQPIYAVQFHPESILSLKNNSGLKIIENLMSIL